MSCNQKTHMERNENPIYDLLEGCKKEKQRHPKVRKK
jgi:hypothetical protein